MNDILIGNEKFFIKSLRYTTGLTTLKVEKGLKNKLRYQRLFLIGKGNIYKVLDLSGLVGDITVPSTYEKAYVIVRTDKTITKAVKYDEDDIRVIKCLIHYFSGIKPEITEKLCKVIGYNILSDYHKVYGLKGLSEFKDALFKKSPIKIGQPEFLCYGRPRYNILRLISDLVKAGDVQLFTDPELIGKYKRISRKVDSGSVVLEDTWAKFTGISGNRTRANISLTTLSKVKAVVPENEVGVEPGERILTSIRSFTIIVDGKLNMEEIGIKTSNTQLIGKLKRLGVLEPMLFEDEYVISLYKLPVFSTPQPVSSVSLGYAEYFVRESEIREKYISLLIHRQEKKLKELPRKLELPEEKTDSTLFLESLGIYGDLYYPKKTKTLTSEKSYTTTEVIGKVKGIPENLYPNIRDFINSGKCKNAVISQALKDLAVYRDTDDLEVLKNVKSKIEKEKKEDIETLRNLKFRVISGKTLTLLRHKQLENAIVDLGPVKVSWNVKEVKVKV